MCNEKEAKSSYLEHFIKLLGNTVSQRTRSEYIRIAKQIIDNNFNIKSRSKYLQFNAVKKRLVEWKIINDTDVIIPKWVKREEAKRINNIEAKILSEDCFKQALNLVPDTNKGIELKNAMYLAYIAGMRLNEVLKYTPADLITNGTNYIIVREGKGNKRREILIKKTDVPKLKNIAGFTITENYIKTNIARISDKLGKDFSFHSLRHTSATRWLNEGIELNRIQKWLGHSDINTTTIYLQLLPTEINDKLKKLGYWKKNTILLII